jgi:hypothetical protein
VYTKNKKKCLHFLPRVDISQKFASRMPLSKSQGGFSANKQKIKEVLDKVCSDLGSLYETKK